MEALVHHTVNDSRETVEQESHYNTFEDLMTRVDAGEITFENAKQMYRTLELGDTAMRTM